MCTQGVEELLRATHQTFDVTLFPSFLGQPREALQGHQVKDGVQQLGKEVVAPEEQRNTLVAGGRGCNVTIEGGATRQSSSPHHAWGG